MCQSFLPCFSVTLTSAFRKQANAVPTLQVKIQVPSLHSGTYPLSQPLSRLRKGMAEAWKFKNSLSNVA